jgi:hypothetical protein
MAGTYNHPLAPKGRMEDEMMAHVAPGEVVIPQGILEQNPQLAQALMAAMQEQGVDPARYVVGNEANSINPETGQPEYFKVGKFFKNVVRPLAPVAAAFIPGVGPLAAAALGAGIGSMGGGGLKGAVTGGLTGGAAGLAAPALKAGISGAGAAYTGAGGGLAGIGAGVSGGLSAAGTALGGSLSGLPGMGTAAGTPLAGGIGATQGTGVAGALSGGGMGSLMAGGSGLGNLTAPMLASNAYGTIASNSAMRKAQREMQEQQRMAAGNFQPYLEGGAQASQMMTDRLASGELGGSFTPGDLSQDPGYQFKLQQGEQALDRANLARGGYFSGAALKEAQQHGQGVADQGYNDAYNRWLQDQQLNYNMLAGQQGAGMNAAGALGGIHMGVGQDAADVRMAEQERINRLIGSSLGGMS